MSISLNYPRECFNKKQYFNGQLAVFVQDKNGEPLAELSIMQDSVDLARDEIILKDYSENLELVEKLIDLEIVAPTDRYVLVGSHLCPVCKVLI